MRKYAWLFGLFLLLTVPALAQDYPKAEIFGGYSYLRSGGANFNGGSGSIAYNPSPWLGILGDIGVYHNARWDQRTLSPTCLVRGSVIERVRGSHLMPSLSWGELM